jgi:hypothetical protein
MRHQLRKTFDAVIGAIPTALVKGLLKTFQNHPALAERAGFQVYPRVFYSPFPDPEMIDIQRLREKRLLPGIDIDTAKALALLEDISRFAEEMGQFPRNPADQSIAWSRTYPSFDTATLYGMIRHLKPRHYIEVGCGWSSRVSSAALLQNRNEGVACEALYIEPYPPPHLKEVELPGKFLKERVERVPLDQFQRLEAGDVLFIDTSHVIKVQNDVEHEFLRILPSLPVGVYVHVHDIFTPYDYPEEWLVGESPTRGGNNEQYALECLLSGGTEWEVVLPVYLLWREYKKQLADLLPGAPDRPAAFWIRKQ